MKLRYTKECEKKLEKIGKILEDDFGEEVSIYLCLDSLRRERPRVLIYFDLKEKFVFGERKWNSYSNRRKEINNGLLARME